ncbi:hypothetical protein VTN02DRAFT_6214 [Thermoascus thermophilus]
MKFLSFSTAAIAALLSVASTIAAPAPNPPSHPSTDKVLYPYATSHYHVSTGAIDYGVDTGLICKADDNNSEVTTLVTFVVPQAWAGKQCKFVFELASFDTSTGSHEADIFSSIAPAGTSTASWPPGNLRDHQVARIFVTAPGVATLEQSFDKFPVLDCPAGAIFGGELVGVNDVDQISWSVVAGSGPRIEVI